MKRQAGLTLVELMIGAVILAIVALLASRLMTRVATERVSAEKRQAFDSDFRLLAGVLQKFMASGDIRFFGFAGRSASSTTGKIISRVLIPQPGRCRDLSTGTECTDHTSFLYIHYDKTTTPAVSTICNLGPFTPPTSVSPQTLLLDGHENTYGDVTFDSATGTITVLPIGAQSLYAAGPVRIARGTLLAAFDPPTATLWVAAGNPRVSTIQQSSGARSRGGVPIPTACDTRLKDDSAAPGNKRVDLLFELDVNPYLLTQFTGNTLINNEEMNASFGKFPMRVFALKIRSVGVMPRPPLPGKPREYDFGISDCEFRPLSMDLDCSAAPFLKVGPVQGARIDANYALALFSAGSPVSAEKFEYLGPLMTVSPGCVSPACQGLAVPLNGAIPSRFGGTEELDRLNAAGFSFLKQETLSNLRFRLKVADGREDAFNVVFP
jgi:prepilin-type N-terminal cleavage/methylation domain-containing protein